MRTKHCHDRPCLFLCSLCIATQQLSPAESRWRAPAAIIARQLRAGHRMRARCSCTMQPKAAFCVVVVILCGAGCHASRVLRGANDGSPRSSSGYPGGWNGGGGGSNWNGGRWNGGGGGWGGAGAAGATAANIVGAVQTGVNVGINLAAPIVNGIASNVPILVPSVGGLCLNGPAVTPFPDRPGIVMCVAGTGADVTNALFNAASTVTNLAGSAFGRRRM